MTSSSSLYGTTTKENVSSTNSTGLYGGAGTPIPDSSGNLIVRGDLWVLSGNVLTTATTGNLFPENATTVNIATAATQVNIGASTGETQINNDLCVVGDTITLNCNAESPASALIQVDRGPGTNPAEFAWNEDYPVPPGSNPNGRWQSNCGITATGLTGGFVELGPNAEDALITTTAGSNQELIIDSDTDSIYLRVNDIALKQAAVFSWDEADDRLNRVNFQSETGDSSGIRVVAPSATTSSSASISAFNTNDLENGKFINFTASGSATTPYRIVTGEYISNVLNSATEPVAFITNGTTYATVNPAGPTNPLDLATKAYVDSSEHDTTYTIDASSTTGGANFNLRGSDASVDTIKFASGTGVTVSQTDSSTITVAIGQSVATTANPTFAGATLGNITVGLTDNNGITTTTGSLDIAPANSTIAVNAPTYVKWAEAGDRSKRFTFQSSSGNTTGVRTLAPNATSSALSTIGAFSSSDIDNGSFINLRAVNSGTDPLRIYTGTYTAGVLGASAGAAFVDNATTYATVNPSGPTNSLDLITKDYFDTHTGGTTNQLVNGSYTFTLDASGNLSSGPVATTVINSTGGLAHNTASLILNGTNATLTSEFSSLNTTSSTISAGDQDATIQTYDSTGPTTNDWTFANNGVTSFPQTSLGTYARIQSPSTTDFQINAGGGIFSLNYDGSLQTPYYKFPGADGTANQVLKTDGSGVLSWYTPSDLNTTYTYTASSTTGGANLTLTGSDSSVNTVKVTSGTGITVADVSSTEISVTNTGVTSLAAGTYLSVNASTGAVTVSTNATNANTASTIVARDGSGNFSAGTITANLANASYILGNAYATRNTSWTPPASGLTTVDGTNGIAVASSGGGNGYSPSLSVTYYSGDTTSGTNSSAALVQRGASGTNSAPTAAAINQVLGTMNFDGYATSGWAQNIATTGSGAGTTAISPLQIQGYAREAFADSAGTVTNAGMGFRVRGFNTATSMSTANRVNFIDHTLGTATYKATTFNIQPPTTTASMLTLGATTGSVNQDTLTLKNNAATTTYATFASGGATIGGTDNPSVFTRVRGASAGTSPALILRNSNTNATTPASNDGTTFRFQTAGTNATNYTIAEISGQYNTGGDDIVSISLANGDQTTGTFSGLTTVQTKITQTTISAGTASGTAGSSSVATKLTVDASKITAAVPIVMPNYTAVALRAITGAVGWMACVNNSASGSNPNGMMAFWDTTNVRWSYVHDNSAV